MVADPTLEMYFAEASKYLLLSHKEQLLLAWRVQIRKDDYARRRLMECNLRLVVRFAKEFQRNHLREALDPRCRPARRPEQRNGTRVTGRTCRRRGRGQRYPPGSGREDQAPQARIVRVPMSHHDAVAKYRRVKREVEDRTGGMATVSDVARRIRRKGTANRIHSALDALNTDTYELDPDSSATIEPRGVDVQFLESRDRQQELELVARLDDAMGHLDEREAKVIRWRFGIGERTALSFSEIARRLRISATHARRLHDEARTKLRVFFVSR